MGADLLASALDALFASQAGTRGMAIKVTIGGHDYPALIEPSMFDPLVLDGAVGNAGQVTFTVRQSDLADAPAVLTACTVQGVATQILSVNNHNGIAWRIMCGDPGIE